MPIFQSKILVVVVSMWYECNVRQSCSVTAQKLKLDDKGREACICGDSNG